MKRLFGLFFLLSFCSLWANGGQEAQTTENQDNEIILLTSSAKFKETYRTITEKMEENEGLKVDLQVIPDDQYQNLVQIKLTSNEVPDILMNNAPEQYFAMKAESTMYDLSGQPWVPNMINANMVTDENGKIWAMPQESGSFFGACYYNMDILSSLGIENPAPKTFDEFIALLKEIKAADPDVIPFFMNHRDSWTTQAMTTIGYSVALNERGPQVYNDIMTNKLKFSDVPEFKLVLNEFKKIIDLGLVNKDHLSAGYDDGLAAVASGKAAMIFNGEWALSSLESEGANIGTFLIPWNDNDIMCTGAYVQGFYVPKHADNLKGALSFLNLYSSPEYMDMYYSENPGFPAFTGVNGGSVNPQLAAMVKKYMAKGTVYQMNDYMTPLASIWSELWGAYVEFAADTMDNDEVLSYWDDVIGDHMATIGQPGW